MTKNIKSERVRLGLTQEQLANMLSIHVNTVRLWERNECQPSSNNLLMMSKIFGCTPDYLLGLTEERTIVSGPVS